MRAPVLIAATAALAACANETGDATCEELERDAGKRRAMTQAVRDATQRDADVARAAWETVCANATPAERREGSPYQPAVNALNRVE